MKKNIALLVAVFIFISKNHAQKIDTYEWPIAENEAILSDKYKVSIIEGNDTLNSMVIQSKSKDLEIPDFAREMRGGRTFNWTMFSSDFSKPLKIIVEKIFGTPTNDIEIVPSPFKINKKILNNGQKVEIILNEPKYVCINFKSQDNIHTSDGVVKHMLMIFGDPLETDVPVKNDPKVHVYSKISTVKQMDDADIIYFPKGYHDLKVQYDDVSNMAKSINKRGKKVYFEGGAYVHGRIYNATNGNVKIYGRGVLSGRDFKWSERLAQNGGKPGVDSYTANNAHIGFSSPAGSNTIEGIVVCDGAGHGVNLGISNNVYRNFKTWAWHPNNDGMRPWGVNNTIANCFVRACDDAMYNKGLTVTNTIFWQGFNGSIITTGWDGAYNTENSLLKDNYIIYPEWRGLGNNNGIVMSQQDFDMSGTNVVIENLTVDGNVPALVNLKTNSGKTDFVLPTDFGGKIGKIDNIHLKNVVVTGNQATFNGDAFQQTPIPSKNVIKGAIMKSGEIFFTSNVSFTNVTINGKCISDLPINDYFTIDPMTTKNIQINSCDVVSTSINESIEDQYTVFPNPSSSILNLTKHAKLLEIFNSNGQKVISIKEASSVDISGLKSGLYFMIIENSKSLRFLKY